ncbi:hypothetical protein GF373_17915 [bacterium]|nr:hypothetical protein [bacterium]
MKYKLSKSQRLSSLKYALMLIFLTSTFFSSVAAAHAQSAMPPSNIDTSGFDNVLEPVWKVYGLIKYVATAIAAIVLVIAGISFMTSGTDIGKRDKAKNMIAFVVVGLGVIWVAPYIVQMFTA